MVLYTSGENPAVLNINKSATEFLKTKPNELITLYATATKKLVSFGNDIDKSEPVRDFAILEVSTGDSERITSQLDSLFDSVQYLILSKNDKINYLVIELKQRLSKHSYSNFVESFAKSFNIVAKPRFKKVSYGFKIAKTSKVVTFHKGGKLDANLLETATSSNLAPDSSKITKQLIDFINSPAGQQYISENTNKQAFIDALATNYLKSMLDRLSIGQILENIPDSDDLYIDRLNYLRSHAEMREEVKPLSYFIALNGNRANTRLNLAQQLLANLPDDVLPNAEFKLEDAGNLIESMYPPYLLDQEGSDSDNMVIYNPQEGVWTSNRDLLYSLLTAIKPYSTQRQLDTFISTFAAKARNANRLIRPYSGSRYLLFKNCVLDVKTMQTYPLSNPLVEQLHFTLRARLDINYQDNPEMPVFEHDLSMEEDSQFKNNYDFDDEKSVIDKNWSWTPYNFLMAYGNNTPETYNYFLFGIALGLFGAHNFGVHFDICGDSRWGKTQIYTMLDNLHGHRSVNIDFPSLNDQFPFTSYSADTAVIWLDEANAGQDPLDDNHGTLLYDKLADPQVRFQSKHNGDIIINNPPQVYISGTGFIKARDLFTGPAGRTLAYKLVHSTQTLRAQSYSRDIDARLRDEKVLQWIVYQAIIAYKNIVPESRIDNFRMNLSNRNDLNLLPEQAHTWRKEFVVGGDLIDDWFGEQIEPYISHDVSNPTLLHKRVIYEIYISNYKTLNPQDQFARNAKSPDEVMRRLEALFTSQEDKYDYHKDLGSKDSSRRKPRKLVSKPDSMNFDWNSFDKDAQRPMSLAPDAYNQFGLFGKKASGWFSLALKK